MQYTPAVETSIHEGVFYYPPSFTISLIVGRAPSFARTTRPRCSSRQRRQSRKGAFCIMGRFIDLTGQRFERLVVLERVGFRNHEITWLCQCDCGKRKLIKGGNLRKRLTRSCGCLAKEQTSAMMRTHGMTQTRVYRIWAAMHRRCYEYKFKQFSDYGGRGIEVCESWHSFENFFADMGNPPSPSHSLDRKDVNGHYHPDNCKWATALEQGSNKRDNTLITFRDKTQTLSEWARETGLQVATVCQRLRRGASIERALTSGKLLRISKQRICLEPECSRMSESRGLCGKHYQRLRAKQRGGWR